MGLGADQMSIFRQNKSNWFIFNILTVAIGVHKNVFPANLDAVAINTHSRVLADLTRGDVVLPPMPRAGNYVLVHDPLAQRPAPVQAGIIDGIELAPHVGQSNRFALYLELSDRSRRDFVRFRCSRKRHLRLPLRALYALSV